jgi:hypothetical protein
MFKVIERKRSKDRLTLMHEMDMDIPLNYDAIQDLHLMLLQCQHTLITCLGFQYVVLKPLS